jgi:surfactin synthase thioesterase subunit/NAD(P)-dependent dehydrogenase (short-subunit alcohol dehydrogenase family)/acyl carrier protein
VSIRFFVERIWGPDQLPAGALERFGATVTVYSPRAGLTRLADVGDEGPQAVMYVPNPPTQPDDWLPATVTTLRLAQRLAASDRPALLWLLTPHAISVHRDDHATSPGLHSVWGLGRALSLETPHVFGGLVDLPDYPDAESLAALVAILAASTPALAGEELALREGSLWRRRLVRVSPGASHRHTWTPHGTALVTGGTGALGAHLARWLTEQGATHLVLSSRRGRSAPGADALIEALGERGCAVEVVACDTQDAEAVDALVARLVQAADHPPLQQIFHCAGVASETSMRDHTAATLRREMGAKVGGAWALHHATVRHQAQIDTFVLYGSIAGLWGSAQQGAYSAANAGLTGLASYRRDLDLPATVVHWGAWAGGGMVDERFESHLLRRGLRPMAPPLANHALGLALMEQRNAVAVADVDWSRFATALAVAGERPLLYGVSEAAKVLITPDDIPSNETGPADLAWLDGLAPEQWPMAIRSRVLKTLTSMLALDVGEISASASLLDLGFDSVMAVEFSSVLRERTGLRAPATLVLQSTTIDELVAELLEQSRDRTGVSTAEGEAGTGISSLRSSEETPGSWLVTVQRAKDPKMRLLCFPYAGGGAAVYQAWRNRLPESVEVLAVEQPGRGRRLVETPVQSIADITSGVVEALQARPDLPLMIFGHCLGAIVAYEFLRVHTAAGGSVRHFFASGAAAPHLYTAPSNARATDAQVLRALEELGLAGLQAMKNDPEFFPVAMGIVRHDLDLAGTYQFDGDIESSLPLTTFSASSDAFAPTLAVDRWKDYTAHPDSLRHYQYSGGHYFVESERDSILEVITEVIEAEHASSTVTPRPVPRLSPTKPLAVVGLAGAGTMAADLHAVMDGLSSDNVETLVLEPPGHGIRADQPPLRRLDVLATLLELELSPVGSPIILVGHGIYAHVALAIARRRLERGLPVEHLVLSCAMAPTRYVMPPLRVPRSTRLLAQEVQDRVEADSIAAAAVDADLSLSFHHVPSTQWDPIPTPITAVVARDDGFVPPNTYRSGKRVRERASVERRVPTNMTR